VPAQGVTIDIDAGDPERVIVRVRNGGVIPRDVLPKLFEPMAGSDRRGDKSQGLGLGLYITQQIVKAHDGVIFVDTSEADGTTFTVHLPRTACSPRSEGDR
jgi:signal transduction histidine kinase